MILSVKTKVLNAGLVLLASCLTVGCAGNYQPKARSLKDLTREQPRYQSQPEVEQQQLSQEELRAEAIENYRAFIQLMDDGPERREAMRRLADLLVDSDPTTSDVPQVNLGRNDDGPNDGLDDRDGPTTLYRDLLQNNPDAADNDRVLYQLARAQLADGKPQAAIASLKELTETYPDSKYVGEANLRRAELLFIQGKYPEAGRIYQSVLGSSAAAEHHEHARYKLGWSLFKQGQYLGALDTLHPLLEKYLPAFADQKKGEGQIGVDLNALTKSRQRLIADALRVANLSFTYAGDDLTLSEYQRQRETRDGEPLRFAPTLYASLAAFFAEKERYADAAEIWREFELANPTHAQAPLFADKRISVYETGGFAGEALEARRDYVERYRLDNSYWLGRNKSLWPVTLKRLKESVTTLAKYHHAQAQDLALSSKDRRDHFAAAARWYRAWLDSFAQDADAPQINFLLAETLDDSGQYEAAALAFEKTAYEYGKNPRGAEAGYAAVLSWQKLARLAPQAQRAEAERRASNAALKFADRYADDPQTPRILVKAAEARFAAKDYAQTLALTERLLQQQTKASADVLRTAAILNAHSQFETGQWSAAEQAYQLAISKTPTQLARERSELNERLAASIYKQAEGHQQANEADAAIIDFLRIASVAPISAIAATAHYDATAVLIQQKNWPRAANELKRFRQAYPNHPRQADVTTKLAAVYSESDQPSLAAAEFQRLGNQRGATGEQQEEALLQAAQLYDRAGQQGTAILAWQDYLQARPTDLQQTVYAQQRLIELQVATRNHAGADRWREALVQTVTAAGNRVDDTARLSAANAALSLAEKRWANFEGLGLSPPFQLSLPRKRNAMNAALAKYEQASAFGIAEITTQATYRTAEMYHHLHRALLASERPAGLSELEREEYDLLLEEQADPFATQAIELHEGNISRVFQQLADRWVLSSLEQLAELNPGEYGRNEKNPQVVKQYE